MNDQTILDLRNQCRNLPVYPDPRFPPSSYYRFLRALAAYMKPELSVELGVCGGGGSLHLALGWPNSIVIGVDFAWDHAENVEYIMKNYNNFHFLLGDSVKAAQDIHATHGDIDILFIDTTHTYEQTMAEYKAYLPFLSDRAVVCLDDLFRPGMDRVWVEMPEPKVRLDTLHISEAGGGFGVVF